MPCVIRSRFPLAVSSSSNRVASQIGKHIFKGKFLGNHFKCQALDWVWLGHRVHCRYFKQKRLTPAVLSTCALLIFLQASAAATRHSEKSEAERVISLLPSFISHQCLHWRCSQGVSWQGSLRSMIWGPGSAIWHRKVRTGDRANEQHKRVSKWDGGGLVAKSCLTLATPWTVAHQAPLSTGFSRQEYCSGLPSENKWEVDVNSIQEISAHWISIFQLCAGHGSTRFCCPVALVMSDSLWPHRR